MTTDANDDHLKQLADTQAYRLEPGWGININRLRYQGELVLSGTV